MNIPKTTKRLWLKTKARLVEIYSNLLASTPTAEEMKIILAMKRKELIKNIKALMEK